MAKKSPTRADRAPTMALEPAEITNPEVELLQVDGEAITRWAHNAATFFREATALEQQAKSALALAQTLPLPKNGTEDASLQDRIRSWSAAKKQIDGHWTITSLLDKLHKRAVAYRRRGTDAYDAAIQIGNGLHNRYVAEERRRVEEENRRRERENEERARRDREEELERLEQQALKAEAASEALSEREQRFVEAVLNGIPPFDAAKRAGYKDPGVMGPRLLSQAKIESAIAAARQAAALRKQAEAVRQAPVLIDDVPLEQPDVTKGGDRTTWRGEVLDEVAFRNAAFEGTHGIPRDCFTVDLVKLNEYARSMHENLDRWPGVRAKKTTRVV